MGFFRRDKPLHEQLAEEAGLDIDGSDDEFRAGAVEGPPESPVSPASSLLGVKLASNMFAVNGIPRDREWDGVASAEAPGLPGQRVDFVALADGTLVVDEDLPDGALEPLANALEVTPPYHGVALRRDGDVWSVAARRVDIVEIPEDVPGDEVDMVVNDGRRTVLLDEAEAHAEIPTLESFAGQRFGSFVLHASRLDDTQWEVTILPL